MGFIQLTILHMLNFFLGEILLGMSLAINTFTIALLVYLTKNSFFTKSNPNISFLDNNYIDAKKFFFNRFKSVPDEYSIYGIDVVKSFDFLNQQLDSGYEIHQRCYYDHDEKKLVFSRTIIVSDDLVFEIASSHVSILSKPDNREKARKFIDLLSKFIDPPKEGSEINIISKGYDGLELKKIDISPINLDIDLYYNDDFKEVDKLIKERLSKDQDKGIILLHGMPGTGKTTYLRHLIGFITKKVLFVSPSIASNLTDPDFVDLLISNPNCVLIIEDAENIIMDRKNVNNQSVSNLLNISDGLLSDCLNVQIICTFNTALSNIDSALLRKGRLIAHYKFDKLTPEKAQRLSDYHNFGKKIDGPKTIAEIMNQNEPDFSSHVNDRQKIGFGVSNT